jgi:hypothetical protein
VTLKEYILHQLGEMRREMLTTIEGLSEEDLLSHEPGSHSPIAWIIQHCVSNVDHCIHMGITGRFLLDHDIRFRAWPLIEPKPGDEYPPLPEMIDRWKRVTDASIDLLRELPEERLQERSLEDESELLAESCLRCTNHQNAHLRQAWCILGRRRVDDRWPEQGAWLT